jgi:hypothetical protein
MPDKVGAWRRILQAELQEVSAEKANAITRWTRRLTAVRKHCPERYAEAERLAVQEMQRIQARHTTIYNSLQALEGEEE